MQVPIKKWGNCPAIRIPAAIMKAARLTVDQAVDIRVENGRVVIERLGDLSALLAGITDENGHAEVDFGRSLGPSLPTHKLLK